MRSVFPGRLAIEGERGVTSLLLLFSSFDSNVGFVGAVVGELSCLFMRLNVLLDDIG